MRFRVKMNNQGYMPQKKVLFFWKNINSYPFVNGEMALNKINKYENKASYIPITPKTI